MTRRGETGGNAAGPGRPEEREVHRVWLSGGPDAPSGARAAVDLLTVERFDELGCSDIRLLVSEIVTNSVRHGGAGGLDDSIQLILVLSESGLRLECADPLGGFDAPSPPADPSAASASRGLSLVDQLSSAWGTRYGAAGSAWFEFDGNGNGNGAAPA